MSSNGGDADPIPPIDWSGPRPSSIWEEEPEQPGRPPRRLLALLLALLVAGAGVAVVARSLRSARPHVGAPIPSAVGSLTATAISPVEVELRWSAAEGAVEYAVFRDGVALTTIRSPSTGYRDTSVQPESSYQYGVAAVDAAGRHADRVMVSATTPPAPPLSEARLEGRWEVTLTFLEENYTNRKKGDRFTETWEFFPRCEEGACNVRVDLFYRDQERTILHRDGGTYRGDGEAKLDRCEGVRIATTISLEIIVTEADFVGGVWQAVRFTGTDETDSPAALTCRAGHGLMELVGEPA